MSVKVKHYQSDWWGDDPNVFDDTPSAPTPTKKKKATPETRAKIQTITTDRKTGKKTYGPEEDVPVKRIKAEEF